MPHERVALSPALPSELLTYVLTHQAYPTTLIICSTRANFLSSLLQAVKHTSLQAPEHEAEDDNEGPSPSSHISSSEPQQPPPRHPLLVPTLHQVAKSRHISLIFTPTVSHLRAYLTVLPRSDMKAPPNQKFDKPGKNEPLVVVYGLLELHRYTSEWSAQGLGNSLAALVEGGWRTERRVVVLEERKLEGRSDEKGDPEGRDVEMERDREEQRGVREAWRGWQERVPILNGSVRRAGFEGEDAGWSGRTVEVSRILGRWFTFGEGDWEIGVQD